MIVVSDTSGEQKLIPVTMSLFRTILPSDYHEILQLVMEPHAQYDVQVSKRPVVRFTLAYV